MAKVKADAYVDRALTGGYLGTPYKQLDCQAFVEQVLKDCNALSKNWRGSNQMWRDAVYDRSDDMAAIQPGEWVFTVRHDGGEVARGYHDDMGNAKHVGLYLGNGEVMHSTTGGVQMSSISDGRWTHHAKVYDVAYPEEDTQPDGVTLDDIMQDLLDIRDQINTLIEAIEKR